MKTILLWFLVGSILFSVATTAFGQAPDRRICDNDGDCLSINSDGSVDVG